MGKAVWPDEKAKVQEMQSTEWYLAATVKPSDVDLNDRKVNIDPKRGLELALKHAEQFRRQAWEYQADLEQAILAADLYIDEEYNECGEALERWYPEGVPIDLKEYLLSILRKFQGD